MQLETDADGDLVVARRPAAESPPEEEVVLSEVHMESRRPAPGCRAATTFTDGAGQAVVSVQHSMATPLRAVGLQVWRGALLLADLVVHRGAAAFGGATALELGAGSGLAGVVLSRFASTVYLTDTGADVLANCAANAGHHSQQHGGSPGDSGGSEQTALAATPQVLVRQLDWMTPPDWLLERPPQPQPQPLQQQPQHPPGSTPASFAWRQEDAAALQRLDFLLAADSVYDNVLTEAFMRSAVLLMRYARRHSGRSPRLLVGLERRICFTMTDQAVRAPAYDFWRTLFEAVQAPTQGVGPAGAAAGAAAAAAKTGLAAAEQTAGAREQRQQQEEQEEQEEQRQQQVVPGSQLARRPGSGSALVPASSPQQPPFPLVGWQIDLATVPQALHPYERSQYLELWELALRE